MVQYNRIDSEVHVDDDINFSPCPLPVKPWLWRTRHHRHCTHHRQTRLQSLRKLQPRGIERNSGADCLQGGCGIAMAATMKRMGRHAAPAIRGWAQPRRALATATLQAVRLPDLDYDYGALEPVISGEIMKLHHQKHHQTYVTGFNKALEQVESSNDPNNLVALQSAINFNGGGACFSHRIMALACIVLNRRFLGLWCSSSVFFIKKIGFMFDCRAYQPLHLLEESCPH